MSLPQYKGPDPIGTTFFLIPLACFAMGIWIASIFPGGITIFVIPAILSLMAIASRLVFTQIRRNPYLSALLFNLFFDLLMFALGGTLYILNRPVTDSPTAFKGKFIGEVETVSHKTYGDLMIIRLYAPDLQAETDTTKIAGRPTDTKILATSTSLILEPGDIILFKSKLTPLTVKEGDTDTGFVKNMRDHNVLWRTRLYDKSTSIIGKKSSPYITAQRIRQRIEIFIEKCGLEKATSSFLIAVLLGDKSFIDSSTRRTFADGGVSHVLALSGMHIGIIVAILMTLFFPLNFTGKRHLRYVVTLTALWGYAFITGLSPTIVRASLMTSFAFIARFLQRKGSAMNALCLATLLILIFSPEALFDIGLQLSFLCVASILLFVRQLNRVDQATHPYLYDLNAMILTSVVATFATWILTARNFGIFPLMFLPANLIILPLLPIYLSLALLNFLINLLGFNFSLLGNILDIGFDALIRFLNFLSHNGVLTVSVTPSLHSVIIWLAGMGVLAYGINKQQGKRWIIGGASILLLSLILL